MFRVSVVRQFKTDGDVNNGWAGSSDFSLGGFLLMLQATFSHPVPGQNRRLLHGIAVWRNGQFHAIAQTLMVQTTANKTKHCLENPAKSVIPIYYMSEKWLRQCSQAAARRSSSTRSRAFVARAAADVNSNLASAMRPSRCSRSPRTLGRR